MDRKNFIQNQENFACEHCGFEVAGTGYTNHCPECLWSKHVDNVPGDRSNSCLALMEPIQVAASGDEYDIVHKCTRCFMEKNNKRSPQDNFETLLAILKQS